MSTLDYVFSHIYVALSATQPGLQLSSKFPSLRNKSRTDIEKNSLQFAVGHLFRLREVLAGDGKSYLDATEIELGVRLGRVLGLALGA